MSVCLRTLLIFGLALNTIGCGNSELDELATEVVALEATGYFVCGIDRLGTLSCMDDTEEGPTPMNLSDLAGFDYVALTASQTSICAVRDNTGEGSGDIHCFNENIQYGGGFYDVYEGNFTTVTMRDGVCGLEDGEIACPVLPDDPAMATPPAGPFEAIWSHASGYPTGIYAVDAAGGLVKYGNEPFENVDSVCPVPSGGVVDIDGGAGLAILTDDGAVTGWDGWGMYASDCIAMDFPADSFAVSYAGEAICTLAGTGYLSCEGGEDWQDFGMLATLPAGEDYQHITTYGGWGAFMCVSAGSEVTCWGSGWNEGEPQTFSFTE